MLRAEGAQSREIQRMLRAEEAQCVLLCLDQFFFLGFAATQLMRP